MSLNALCDNTSDRLILEVFILFVIVIKGYYMYAVGNYTELLTIVSSYHNNIWNTFSYSLNYHTALGKFLQKFKLLYF